MIRDVDLVRRILLAIEAKPSTAIQPIHLENSDKQDVLNHLASLHEEGLISGPRPHRSSSTDEFDRVDVRDLTPAGRRLLAELRNTDRYIAEAVEFSAGSDDTAAAGQPRSTTIGITGAEATTSVGQLRVATQNGEGESASSNAQPRPAVIVAAVRSNQVAIQLAAFSLLKALDAKIEAMHTARSNSEDRAQYEHLKRLVEEFLASTSSANEAPVVEKTLSLADGLKSWWTKDHANICSKALNVGLFVGGVSICGLAGAYGISTASMVTVGALIGGKNVADSLAALAKILPGKQD